MFFLCVIYHLDCETLVFRFKYFIYVPSKEKCQTICCLLVSNEMRGEQSSKSLWTFTLLQKLINIHCLFHKELKWLKFKRVAFSEDYSCLLRHVNQTQFVELPKVKIIDLMVATCVENPLAELTNDMKCCSMFLLSG